MNTDEIMALADAYGECLYLRKERYETREALRTAIEALVADAERYRLLRIDNPFLSIRADELEAAFTKGKTK